jgi:4-hydroxy-4-methyl-2-oxoglutarate aldolase
LTTPDYETLARLGVATIHEASGKQGLVDVHLHQIVPGSRVAGPARTCRCGHGDNLMFHALVADARPGDVLVFTMDDPAPFGVIGELLTTQCMAQGVAGLLVDAAVRDLDELREIGLPIWSRWLRARGAEKEIVGSVDEPVVVGGETIRPGDVLVLDCDGAVVLPAERHDEVLPLALEREERERAVRERYAAGELSYDVNNLREIVEGSQAR